KVQSLASPDSDAARFAEEGRLAVMAARAALSDLAVQTRDFKLWRDERARERTDADLHSLFREYVLVRGEALLTVHGGLCAALAALATALAALAECLEGALPAREVPRLRRALEILRLELEEERAGVSAWIPRGERGAPVFGGEAFHDLETTAQGDDVLVTRVLLPHEFLGRRYYPELAGAVLISATTWLRGGFEAASAYLGLTRAAEPAPEEEREPIPVATFRAPEAFDYARVLVAVPRDAPPVQDKLAFLAYCARFVAYLAERTRGRTLVLFTNAEDAAAVGAELEPFFAARGLPFWWQGMRGLAKEELGALFRARVDSVLLGLDAYWYGADFPGETLEYLVLARLPYGVPDRYHHAQCAAMGASEQRKTIYLPRALAKFRQGFGRLMRKESDRGCVFVLDRRVLDPRHRGFLDELPLANAFDIEAADEPAQRRARLVQGDSARCLRAAFTHMDLEAGLARRGLTQSFEGFGLRPGSSSASPATPQE
ncbi:MAG: helicase C-terminal domain-containing protein, partial [Planctomycetota bacterium]